MPDLKQVDLKQMRDDVADRVSRAAGNSEVVRDRARELGSGAGNAARELAATAEESLDTQIRKHTRAARRRASGVAGRRLAVFAGAAAGAVAVYFFDPQRGRARRAQFVDWSGARLRRGWRALNQLGARTGSNAAALPQRMVSLRSGRARPPTSPCATGLKTRSFVMPSCRRVRSTLTSSPASSRSAARSITRSRSRAWRRPC